MIIHGIYIVWKTYHRYIRVTLFCLLDSIYIFQNRIQSSQIISKYQDTSYAIGELITDEHRQS